MLMFCEELQDGDPRERYIEGRLHKIKGLWEEHSCGALNDYT